MSLSPTLGLSFPAYKMSREMVRGTGSRLDQSGPRKGLCVVGAMKEASQRITVFFQRYRNVSQCPALR